MKTCIKCEKSLRIADFHRDKVSGAPRPVCKACDYSLDTYSGKVERT